MDDAPQTGEFMLGESFAAILTETTQSLVCVFDRDGRILLFNDACERATGFRREEVLGRDARDFVIPREERDAFSEFLTYVWNTGVPAPQVGHWQAKDGARRLIAWSNKPMAGPGGESVALVTTGIDLTDRGPQREADDRALEGDPGRSSPRSASSPPSSARPARGHPRRGRGEPRASSRRCRRSARACSGQRVGDHALQRRRTATIVGQTDNIDVSLVGRRWPPTSARRRRVRIRARRGSTPGQPARRAGRAIFRVGYRSSAAAPTWSRASCGARSRRAGSRPAETENRLAAFCELVAAVSAPGARRSRRPRAPGPPATSSGAGSSATSTTARSGTWCPSPYAARRARVRRSRGPREAARRAAQGRRRPGRCRIARGLRPAILGEHGLARALEALVERLPVEVRSAAGGAAAEPRRGDGVPHRVEALTNVVKHAQAAARR
jgi:PAS domain S-box-containing protein